MAVGEGRGGGGGVEGVVEATNAKDCGDNELGGEQLRVAVWLRNEEASASFGFPFLPQEVRGQREALISVGDASAMRALLSLLRVAVSSPKELRDLAGATAVPAARVGTGERRRLQPAVSVSGSQQHASGREAADAASGDDQGKEERHARGGGGGETAHSVAIEIVSWRNELEAMRLLRRVVRRQIAAYPTTMEADRAALRGGGSSGGPTSPNGMNAIRLVAGEKHVLKHIEQVARVASSHLQEVGRRATSETAEAPTAAAATSTTTTTGELPVSDVPPPNCLLDVQLSGLDYRQLLGYLLTRTSSLAAS